MKKYRMNKSLYDISWKVDENTYRKDPSLSYSTIAKYEREVVSGKITIDHLFDRIDTKSLTLGSAVDSIITGGLSEFNQRFVVSNNHFTDGMIKIATQILADGTYNDVSKIPLETLNQIAKRAGYYVKSDSKRLSELQKMNLDAIQEYIKLKKHNRSKTILDSTNWNLVFNAVHALKNDAKTQWYFTDANDGLERLYQLKFKACINGVPYRCMMDECIIDHVNKIIYPIDLKTSSHIEKDFYQSFTDWSYWIQAELYSAILRTNLDKDDYFKDFIIVPYRFIVVNFQSCMPEVWEFEDTFKVQTLQYTNYTLRHAFEIGRELYNKLNNIVSPTIYRGTLNSICLRLNQQNTYDNESNNTESNEDNDIITVLMSNYHSRHNVAASNDLLNMLSKPDKIQYVKKWCNCNDMNDAMFGAMIKPLIEANRQYIDNFKF